MVYQTRCQSPESFAYDITCSPSPPPFASSSSSSSTCLPLAHRERQPSLSHSERSLLLTPYNRSTSFELQEPPLHQRCPTPPPPYFYPKPVEEFMHKHTDKKGKTGACDGVGEEVGDEENVAAVGNANENENGNGNGKKKEVGGTWLLKCSSMPIIRSTSFDIEGTCRWKPPKEWETSLGSQLTIKQQCAAAIEEMERERLLAYSRRIVEACKRFGL